MSFSVLGTGSYLPEKTITNNDLQELVETSDEWISKRVGVRERRVCTFETTEYLAFRAAQNALESAGVGADELDLIICSTMTGDLLSPTVAASVQEKIGAECPAFDVNSACSGFVFALETAAGFFARGKVKKALVIAAERVSKIVDWHDRNTCVIFGDGAGAFVLGEGGNYLSSRLYTKGSGDVIEVPSHPGSSIYFNGEIKPPAIYMNGQETFKFAVSKMSEYIVKVVEDIGLTVDDIDHIIPHQANIRIIQFAAKRLGIPIEKFFINIQKVGNTSSASVPIAFDELNKSGALKKGDLAVLAAFGAGLSCGACAIRL